MFEISKTDLAGRIGTMYTNHGKIETPAFVPVIHPVKQTIPSKKIKEIGFDKNLKVFQKNQTTTQYYASHHINIYSVLRGKK